jgi:rhodanese-related sulfurtransferase
LSHSVPELKVEDITTKNDFVYLDAREREEFEVSHIQNAKWIGYKDFDLNRLKGVSKNDTLVVYCSVGYRSEKIAEKLINEGYTNVFNLYGSIFEWSNQGRPVYDSNNNKTNRVHAYNKRWSQWLFKGEKVY